MIESPAGPVLVYDWRDGDLVGAALDRFKAPARRADVPTDG
ncbi:hypothetical protein OHA18_31920 [Kribbella sp. NBC_00709]|nr:hypothetical protein [Kribbella sp. NBC_00709]